MGKNRYGPPPGYRAIGDNLEEDTSNTASSESHKVKMTIIRNSENDHAIQNQKAIEMIEANKEFFDRLESFCKK